MFWIHEKCGYHFHEGITWSLDSKYLFTCDKKNVVVFSVATGEVSAVLEGHTALVTCVITDPNQPTRVYSSSLDGVVHAWNWEEGTVVEEIGMEGPVQAIVLDSEAEVLYCLQERDVVEYSISNKTKSILYTMEGVGTHLKLHHQGYLFSSCGGSTLGMWNCKKREHRRLGFRETETSVITEREVNVITAVAVSPEENLVVVGDSNGHVGGWYFGHEISPRKFNHWHQTVLSLTFTLDGLRLLSGGEEAVLVMTRLETNDLKFLPRLGGNLTTISVSPDSMYFALMLDSTRIKVIRSSDHGCEQDFRSMGTVPKDLASSLCVAADPQTGLIVANTSLGKLEFFDPKKQRIAFDLQVVPAYTKVNTAFNSMVDLFAFDRNGENLATVEYLALGDRRKYTLKFWRRNKKNQPFVENTRVNDPHKYPVTVLLFHPSCKMAVSCSDFAFRIWVLSRPNASKERSAGSWSCRSTGTYKKKSCKAASFSQDGSLLAVAFAQTITLWDPHRMVLLKELSHPEDQNIKKLEFIAESPYIVASSRRRVFVWSILDCSVQWTYSALVEKLAVDPLGGHFAIVCSSKEGARGILLFSVWSPKPISSCSVDEKVQSICFTSSAPSVSYITESQELRSLEPVRALDMDTVPTYEIEPTKASRSNDRLKIDVLTAPPSEEQLKTQEKENGPQFIPRTTQAAAAASLFDAPSHVLPPVTALYKSFMDIMVIKEEPREKQQTNAIQTDQEPMDEVPKAVSHPKKQQSVFKVSTEDFGNMVDFFKTMHLEATPQTKDKSKKTPRKGRRDEMESADPAINGTPKKRKLKQGDPVEGAQNGHAPAVEDTLMEEEDQVDSTLIDEEEEAEVPLHRSRTTPRTPGKKPQTPAAKKPQTPAAKKSQTPSAKKAQTPAAANATPKSVKSTNQKKSPKGAADITPQALFTTPKNGSAKKPKGSTGKRKLKETEEEENE